METKCQSKQFVRTKTYLTLLKKKKLEQELMFVRTILYLIALGTMYKLIPWKSKIETNCKTSTFWLTLYVVGFTATLRKSIAQLRFS